MQSADHGQTKTWVDRSANAGRPWVVANDEQGGAGTGVKPDADDPAHDSPRKNMLWGCFMAGGAGNEYYFGYNYAHSDLTCQDFRSRNLWWDQCRYALEFLKNNTIPFQDMTNDNNLTSNSSSYCFFKAGEIYIVYLRNGGTTNLNLSGASGTFEVKWFDPRNGGALQDGSVTSVTGAGTRALGNAPSETTKDWTILVRKTGSGGNNPPSVNAGGDQSITLPQNSVNLDGTVTDDGQPAGTLTTAWSKDSGPGTVTFGNASAVDTTVTFSTAGVYVLRLTADDTELTSSDTVTITVNDPAQQDSVVSFTLINADTDLPVAGFDPLNDGATLNLATLPTRNLNIRANTNPATVGSVKFGYDSNPNYRTENAAPYALAGDSSGNYNPWTPTVGSHTLTATPYTGSGATGTAGNALTINFTVIDDGGNQPPTAVNDSASVNEDSSVTINVLANDTDPDSDPLTVVSVQDPGNGTAVKNGDNTITYTPNADYNGADSFTYTIGDGNGGTDTATVSITVNPVNDAPSANNDTASVNEDSSVTINVLANDSDIDGDSLSVTTVGTPSHGTAVKNGDNTITYTPSVNYNGSDSFTYSITDGNGGTATATVNVTVNSVNDSPAAQASANPTSGTAPLAVTFSSGGSNDPDGTIVSYSWDFGDGGSSASANPSHTYTAAGTYTATLTVTDNNGATDSATVTITVTDPANQPPVAAVSANPTSGDAPLAVTFSSAGSSDPDGTVASYAWDFGDGNTSTSANPSHTYTAEGTYAATLTVTDDDGATDSATVTITVTDPPNQPPVAQASANPTSGTAPLAVTFSSAGSSDPDGTIVSYSWDFGDGNTSTSANPSHTYTAEGTYTVTLTVTDDQGATDTDTITIQVDKDPNDLLIVTLIKPVHYDIAQIFTGTLYYIDRSYYIRSMPQDMEGQWGIRTANNDKYETAPDFIQVNVNKPVDVYVMYDKRALKKLPNVPDWMTGYTDTGLSISTKDGGASPLTIYKNSYEAGTISFGGNASGGSTGARSNYFVIIMEQGTLINTAPTIQTDDPLDQWNNAKDTDGDGLTDEYEIDNFLDPNNIDTDGDGEPDETTIKKDNITYFEDMLGLNNDTDNKGGGSGSVGCHYNAKGEVSSAIIVILLSLFSIVGVSIRRKAL
jgi:PKD repeat protein